MLWFAMQQTEMHQPKGQPSPCAYHHVHSPATPINRLVCATLIGMVELHIYMMGWQAAGPRLHILGRVQPLCPASPG
jgi:hypothetical protein